MLLYTPFTCLAHWSCTQTFSKIDCLIIKKISICKALLVSFSQQSWLEAKNIQDEGLQLLNITDSGNFTWLEEGGLLRETYFVFTITLAFLSIGLEIFLGHHLRMIKRNYRSLLLDKEIISTQNADLQQSVVAFKESREENLRTLQVIAHDLRSPMAAIVGLSEFMIAEKKLAEEDLEVVHLIHTSGVDSLKFINEILDKDPAQPNPRRPFNLYALLVYCVEQLKYKAQEKDQRLIFEGDSHIQLKLNREKIWRVINNLISNAMKFSPDHSTITITLKQMDHTAVIAVKDEGIGIPEHLHDKIFGLHADRKREGTAGEKSFGLGLAIAKQITESKGGKLYFESEIGVGTTFYMELPVSAG